jgi:ubiquitin-conjugating enzyme E2 Q
MNLNDKINKYYTIDLNYKHNANKIMNTRLCHKKLIKEYDTIQKKGSKLLLYEINAINDNMYCWHVDMICSRTLLSQSTDTFKIKLEMIFPQNYPLDPPFVRIIEPHIKKANDYIFENGVLCIELLSQKFWSPVISIENLLVLIQCLISDSVNSTNSNDVFINVNNKIIELDVAKKSFYKLTEQMKWV